MTRLTWQTKRSVKVGKFDIPCADGMLVEENAAAGGPDQSGIRVNSPGRRRLKKLAQPLARAMLSTWGTGYVHRQLGRYIRKYTKPSDTLLDVGCGAMQLQRYMPHDCWYNALDVAYSDFALPDVLSQGGLVNPVFASAKQIPVAAESVNIVVSAEALHWIPDVEQVITEFRRVLRPKGKLICSIANGHQWKYDAIGVCPGLLYRWTFDGYSDFMRQQGFDLIERKRVGYWIPLKKPRFLSQLHLPIVPRHEKRTTHFCYVFEARRA